MSLGDWLRGLRERLQQARGRRRIRRARRKLAVPVPRQLELLEARQMLSATVSVAASILAKEYFGGGGLSPASSSSRGLPATQPI